MRLLPQFVFFASLLVCLAACGGGGGGSDNGGDPNGPDPVNPPVFTSPESVTVEEGSISAYTATATDADGDTLTFSLTGGPDQAIFSLDSVTGVLSFNSAPDFDSPADSDRNNRYVVEITVTDGVHRVSQTVTIIVERGPPKTVTISTPSAGQLVEEEVYVSATVQSDFDVLSVTASVEGNSTVLTFSSEAVCTQPGARECRPGFGGILSLDGLAPGTYDLQVTVEDALGNIAIDQRSMVLDNKPTITISEPVQFSVARPGVPLDVSCSDDLGSCDLSARVETSETPIASGTDTLTETLDLSDYDGTGIILIVTATDSAGQSTREHRTIYVETSENLVPIEDFTSQVIDFDGTRALILTQADTGDSLSIQTTDSDTIIDVEVLPGLTVNPARSFLTPTGAIYTTKELGESVLTARIYDWSNFNLIDLGHPDSAVSLTVSGDYAIWSERSTLWRRQFSTGMNTVVGNSAGNADNSVASNGVVAYWSYSDDYSIVRYDAGVSTTLASDIEYWNTYPLTDGERFVYRKHDPCCRDQQYSITFHDGVSERALTSFREKAPSPGRDYAINKGWVAYTELGGIGQTQVWTKSPSGALLQRTIFGSDSYIDGLSPDGAVMLINNSERLLSSPGGQLSSVNSRLGESKSIQGTWYIIIGRSLLKVSL